MQHAAGALARLPPQSELLKMVPPHILDELYDYQRDGVAFAVAHGGRVLLADEMGVGKSRQGLALLATYQWEWPAVIICPSSLKGQWAQLCKEWLSPLLENDQFRRRYAQFLSSDDAVGAELSVAIINKGTEPMDGLINIVSYEMAGAAKEKEMSARNFQVCLLGE